MGKMVDIEKVKTWLSDNFYTSVHNGDYGDYTTLGVNFGNFEEMMADFNKKVDMFAAAIGKIQYKDVRIAA